MTADNPSVETVPDDFTPRFPLVRAAHMWNAIVFMTELLDENELLDEKVQRYYEQREDAESQFRDERRLRTSMVNIERRLWVAVVLLAMVAGIGWGIAIGGAA